MKTESATKVQVSVRLRQVGEKLNKVGSAIKTIEKLGAGVVLPGIDELRDAEKKLEVAKKQYSENPKDKAAAELLVQATQYTDRALADSTDAIVFCIRRRTRDTFKSLGHSAVITLYPKIDTLGKLLDETEDEITRSKRDKDSRSENYSMLVALLVERFCELESATSPANHEKRVIDSEIVSKLRRRSIVKAGFAFFMLSNIIIMLAILYEAMKSLKLFPDINN